MFSPAENLTQETAAAQLAAGLAAIDAGQSVIDLTPIRQIDSSAVACLLAWKRHAKQRGRQIEFQNRPVNLDHLIQLYGVAELL